MQKLLIATSNPGKAGEYRQVLSELPLKLVLLSDLGLSSIEETGATFEENARLKAESYFQKSGLPCIADDGGLEVDALNGEPGVKSRRWKTGDENVTDEELVAYTLERMKGIPDEKRRARLRLGMAFADREGEIFTTEASIE
ncbi:MAG: non-canonical purine NTP pyrophosphatase, partial [Patescibacteria group bacterium]|nr:non-canonical purine NTP pyrophosphatase [Patescibacteria group bacterium]